jgi:nicotinamidase-related amidase
VARRPRASAFQDTGLYEHLAKNNVKTLYICGYSIFETIIATHLCASSHDYDIKVISDCILEVFAKYEGIELAQRFLPRLCDMATAQDIFQLFHQTTRPQ